MGSPRQGRKPTALLLFGYGSEVRQFIYSNFVDELSQKYHVVIAARIISDNLRQLAVQHNFELIELPCAKPNRLQAFVFGKADSCFYRAFQTKEKFSYFGKTKAPERPRRFGTICRRVLAGMNQLERLSFSLLRDSTTDRFLAAIDPSFLIVNLPRSPYFLRTLHQAGRYGIKNCLIFNTLKEIDANGRIAAPIDEYFTWNDASSQELVVYNRHIKPENIHAVGSTYYDRNHANMVPTRKAHFLYCAANPKAIPSEVAFVERLIRELKGAGILEDQGFVVRPNPMDGDFSRWHDLSQRVDVTIKVPMWIWRPDENWNEAMEEDGEIYLELLKEATCVIGSASTVAIDAFVAGTPFLCVEENFWPGEVSQCDFKYFATAENFRLIRQSNAVLCPATFNGLLQSIHEAGRIDMRVAHMPALTVDPTESAGRKIVRELEKRPA